MNDREQLYYIEHKWLPWIFYAAGKRFVKKMLDGGQMFIDLLNAMNEDEDGEEASNYCCPYTAEEFQVRYFLYPDENTTLIQLQMPEPLTALFCRHIYLALNTETDDKFLYTVELAENGSYFLCGWEDNGSHMIFNEDMDDDPHDDQLKVLKIFANHSTNKKEMAELIRKIRD